MATNSNVAVVPGASEAIVQTMVPVDPTAGVVQLKVGPEVWVEETKVVSDERKSVSVTFAAADCPAFEAVTV